MYEKVGYVWSCAVPETKDACFYELRGAQKGGLTYQQARHQSVDPCILATVFVLCQQTPQGPQNTVWSEPLLFAYGLRPILHRPASTILFFSGYT